MHNKLAIILMYLNIELKNNEKRGEHFSINFLGNNEVQVPADNGGYSNYVFKNEQNPLKCALIEILETYYMIEYKHWEELDKPKQHIFHALNSLHSLVK